MLNQISNRQEISIISHDVMFQYLLQKLRNFNIIHKFVNSVKTYFEL